MIEDDYIDSRPFCPCEVDGPDNMQNCRTYTMPSTKFICAEGQTRSVDSERCKIVTNLNS